MNFDKTIFFTVFHPFITKNILNTKVLDILLTEKKLRIVLFVPEIKKDFFIELYQRDNVIIESVPNEWLITLPRFKFISALSHLMRKSVYVTYKRHERLDKNRTIKGYVKFFLESIANEILSRLKISHRIIRKEVLKQSSKEIIFFFDKYRPNLVISADAFDESDCLFQIEAKRRKLRLVSMVRSWDNCYSKGLLRVIPDQIIVNNETIKNEVAELHDVSRDKIHVLGSPQYDVFINSRRTPRTEFFESMGLDPEKKLVLFAPAGKILSDTDGDIIRIFRDAIDSKKFVKQVQFLIRNHPNHPADISSIAGRTDMIVEDPGKTFNRNNPKDTELTLKDNEHLADELYYADVVVWVATTLGMDAMVYDRPEISINFDGFETKEYYKSVRRYHDEDHMHKMLKLGGVRVVSSDSELIKAINHYLENPSLDQEARQKVRDQQFFKLDGNAGKRIGDFLLSELRR